MNRFATGLAGGIAIGLMVSAYKLTDSKCRRRIKRDSRRVMRKAGNLIEDIF